METWKTGTWSLAWVIAACNGQGAADDEAITRPCLGVSCPNGLRCAVGANGIPTCVP